MKIMDNIKDAVSKGSLLNTGAFIAAGTLIGGLVGGFSAVPLAVGALAGFLGTATTGFKLIGSKPPQETVVAPVTPPAPDVRKTVTEQGFAQAPNPGLPAGLGGDLKIPGMGAGKANG